jgi:hypothetical protein
MTAIGAKQLATHITDLQTKRSIKQTEQGRIAAFVAFLTVSLSESCRTMLVWYCELLSAKCLPLYLTKVPSLL